MRGINGFGEPAHRTSPNSADTLQPVWPRAEMSYMRRTIAFAAIACVTVSLGRAQENASSNAAPASRRPLFRSAVELVALNVTVVDKDKRFVSGLGPEDFVVYEKGVQQELAFFGLSDVPVDVALLLDLSASMGPQMDVVKKAAIGFIERLRSEDRAMLVGFAGRATVLQSLTGDIGQLQRAVDQAQPGGHTALYDAMYIVLEQLRREQHASADIRRQVAVVLTDGLDTASLTSSDDVVAAARRGGVVIYTVALQPWSPGQHWLVDRRSTEAGFTLKALAQDSGGLAFVPKTAEELAAIYDRIAVEIAHQYLLAYVPANPPSDGSFRPVSVRLALQVSGEVRTRRGYYATRRR